MILAVERLGFEYDGAPALSEVSFHAAPGEFLALLGPNGSGKTTLLRLLAGLLAPAYGKVRVCGADLATLPPAGVAARVAYLPQRVPAPAMLAYDSVLLARTPGPGGRPGEADHRAAAAAFERLGIVGLAFRPLDRMSGGELARVALARALAREAPLLALDEPTAALDLRHRQETLATLRRLARERGCVIVASLHDVDAALRHADRCLFLKGGAMVALRASDEVEPADVAAAYDLPVTLLRHEGVPVVVPAAPASRERLDVERNPRC